MDMGNLFNLRRLNIKGVPLKKMPPKMCNLKDLQALSDFVVGKNEGSSINELGGLHSLSGKLRISNLQHVDVVENVQESYLKDKEYLSKLECCWSFNDHTDDSRNDQEVLDSLQPHPNLKELVIDGYEVETFPSWLGHSSLNNMVSVHLQDCYNCRVLPPLGQLPSLQELYIHSCHGVKRIGTELYSDVSFSNIKPFRSLKWFEFRDMPEWQEWSFPESCEDGGCFPSLEHLSIWGCPKLNACLPDYFPSLKTLDIQHCEQIAILPGIQEMEKFYPRLVLLSIQNCPKLQIFLLSNFPSNLKEACLSGYNLHGRGYGMPTFGLVILCCENVMTFPEALYPTTLTRLCIEGFHNLRALNGEGFQYFSCLEELIIRSCEELQFCPGEGLPTSLTSLDLSWLPKLEDLGNGLQHLISLKKLSIDDCEKLRCLSENGLPTSLTSLTISSLPSLEDLGNGLQHLISLKQLSIDDCVKLRCLSENELPTSLTSLTISSLPSLEDFGNGLQHLISLKELSIIDCEKLRCLSENGLPMSLTSLTISFLPSLEDLGNGLQHLISLKELSIDDCVKLQCLSENGLPTPLISLTISSLPSLENLGNSFFQPLISLEELSILDCRNLKYSSLEEENGKGGGLKNLVSLKMLHIYRSEDFLGLLEEGLPASLVSLSINSFQNLRNLNGMGFQHLNSLENLKIWNCRNLQCLPEQGLPSSLSSLEILECPLLEQRCQNGTGGDWHKIAHIPHITINFNEIV